MIVAIMVSIMVAHGCAAARARIDCMRAVYEFDDFISRGAWHSENFRHRIAAAKTIPRKGSGQGASGLYH